jgi:photosystem II stability/assembly factor-like uncharacterized protein
MSEANGKKALHVATFSGWYRFEQNGKEWRQTKRDLSYWTLTCMSVDREDPKTIYAGTEHSGLFYTRDGGAHWHRAEPNTPKMMLFSALALNGGVMRMCPTPDGNGMVAGTSDGSLLMIDDSGARELVSALPFVTTVALGA